MLFGSNLLADLVYFSKRREKRKVILKSDTDLNKVLFVPLVVDDEDDDYLSELLSFASLGFFDTNVRSFNEFMKILEKTLTLRPLFLTSPGSGWRKYDRGLPGRDRYVRKLFVRKDTEKSCMGLMNEFCERIV